MNDYELNAFSDDEELSLRKRRVRFRLSKGTVENLIEELDNVLRHPTERNSAVSPTDQILLALRFYATGSFLQTVGDFSGVHATTAGKIIHKVSVALAALRNITIKMPSTDEERLECKRKFYNIARFPMCIGAIDCSHIKIISPGGETAEAFRNRKQFFSLNVQTICDSNLKIMDIVPRWPGSAHDSHIFRNSSVMTRFESGEFGDNCVLVGDSGYPCKSYLLTPLAQTRTRAENLYNEAQIRTRNPVERSYGVWKRRFPGLAMGLRTNLKTTQVIITATAVLHNIACDEREDEPWVNADEQRAIDLVNNNPPDVDDIRNNRHDNNFFRQQLINNYFNNL
ncbi:putative nuclease HARBI1 [Zophobas morio]|uniref:putative nuclease HARBI1 n=1 Tax=Zophobas morio TaxID=2755281 RepID=UPI0030831243